MDKIGVSGNFSGSSTIVGVKFGENCTFVGDNAFEGCTSLVEINDDNVIEEIGSNAFKGCEALPSAIFNKLTSLGTNVFENCTNLKHIGIPKISEIPNSTFYGCSNLLSIDIPNKETFKIGENAFNSCDKLESVNITDTTNIEILKSAFKGCVKLNKINIENCQSIGMDAFYGCSELSQITLSQCKRIKEGAFVECTNLSRVNIKPLSEGTSDICELDNYLTFCYENSDEPLGDILFYIHPDVYNLYISANNWKYYYEKERMLRMVDANQIIYKTSSNKIIDNDYINDDLKQYYIENHTYTTYGNIIFSNNNVNSNSDSDSDSEYNECVITTLEKIFKDININSVSGSDNSETTTPLDITSIDIPSQCENIDDYAFEGLVNLKTITFPNTLTTIGDYAFKDCKSLSKGLSSFTIPKTVTTLGEGVFAGCTEIKKYEGNFVSHGGRVVICNNTLICVCPNDCEFIYNISSDIDESITKLGKSCFYGCENLRRVDIPSTIKKIGDNAFEGCTNLHEIHFHGSTPPELGENVFGDNVDIMIFVPESNIVGYHQKWADTPYINYIYPSPKTNSIIIYVDDINKETISSSYINLERTNYSNTNIGNYYRSKYNNVSYIPSNFITNGKDFITKVILG